MEQKQESSLAQTTNPLTDFSLLVLNPILCVPVYPKQEGVDKSCPLTSVVSAVDARDE